jgi:hypothetical protein
VHAKCQTRARNTKKKTKRKKKLRLRFFAHTRSAHYFSDGCAKLKQIKITGSRLQQ